MKPLPYRKVIKKARKAGFVLRRKTKGTHEIWWNEEKRRTCVIPHHKEVKEEVKVGTLRNIIKQMGLSEKEFKKL